MRVKFVTTLIILWGATVSQAASFGTKWTVDHQLSDFGTHTGASACLLDGTFVAVAHQTRADFQQEIVVRGYTKDGGTAWTHASIVPSFLDESATGEPIVKVDRLGNIYILVNRSDAGEWDTYLMKFSKFGFQWAKQLDFANGSIDQRGDLALDSSGNPVIILKSTGRLAVARYTKDGQLLYRSAYGGSIPGGSQGNFDSMYVDYDADRNVLASGRYMQDLVVFKLGPTGVRQWTRVLGSGPGYPEIIAADVMADGSYICYLKWYAYGEVVKLNPNGTVAWRQNTPQMDFRTAVLQKGGNWILFGDNWNFPAHYRAISYSPNGSIAWNKSFPFPSPLEYLYEQDRPEMLVSLDAFDDIYLSVPVMVDFITDDAQYFTSKMTSYGTLRWTHLYDPAGNLNRVSSNVVNPVTGDLLVLGESTLRSYDAIKAICYKQSVQPTKDSYTLPRNTVLSPAKSVLWNDRYAAEATASILVQPSHGTVQMNGLGYFTYTPTGGYVGPDSFTYRASKSGVDSAQAVVTFAVQ